KHELPGKAFGVFSQRNLVPSSPFLRGFSDDLAVPVSRYNDIDRKSLSPDLDILIDSDEVGICMLDDRKYRAAYMLNHLEYDNTSLADEYHRDIEAGLETPMPVDLFPDNDPARMPENRWRSHA
ncbi:MAG TPA: homoserine O-succinyltransferase, partial [Pelagibacterium sp.]|nr:homoserine O-succinyltransferase [Pelagibacterium sp.]